MANMFDTTDPFGMHGKSRRPSPTQDPAGTVTTQGAAPATGGSTPPPWTTGSFLPPGWATQNPGQAFPHGPAAWPGADHQIGDEDNPIQNTQPVSGVGSILGGERFASLPPLAQVLLKRSFGNTSSGM